MSFQPDAAKMYLSNKQIQIQISSKVVDRGQSCRLCDAARECFMRAAFSALRHECQKNSKKIVPYSIATRPKAAPTLKLARRRLAPMIFSEKKIYRRAPPPRSIFHNGLPSVGGNCVLCIIKMFCFKGYFVLII